MSRHNQLNRIIGKAEALQTELATFYAQIDRLIEASASIRGSDYSVGKVTGGKSELTKTEAAAEQARRWTAEREYVDGLISAAEKALDNARQECTQLTAVKVEVKRCDATGRDGSIEWADPTCWEAPSRGPLCDKCSKREYRWRKAHGLPSRRDGVFSIPAQDEVTVP